MEPKSYENLKIIRFEGEMLPHWAQMLDLAASLCPVSGEVRNWFSRFTNSPGIDDAQTALAQCELLRDSIRQHKANIIASLQDTNDGRQALQIFAAWEYALDTMIQQASSRKTCAWLIDGMEETGDNDFGGGNITLRKL